LDLTSTIKDDGRGSVFYVSGSEQFLIQLTPEKGAEGNVRFVQDTYPEIGRLSLSRVVNQLGVRNLSLLGRINGTQNLRVLPRSESLDEFIMEFVILNKQTGVTDKACSRR
jgi:hypothetical protein